MAFIIDETVLYIKLTDVGRDLLSRGELTFNSFAIGDSEIDYNFIRENQNFNPESASILRPVDNEPDIASFVLKRPAENPLNELRTPIENVVSSITNTAQPRGVFNTTTNTYFDDSIHVKQPSAAVENVNIEGGRSLTLIQHSSYGGNTTEPVVGDYIFIKWSNPDYSGNLSNNLNGENKLVQLTYKIISIDSGRLSDNNLAITVDRDLPDFGGDVGINSTSRVLVYPNNNDVDTIGNAIQTYYGSSSVTDFLTESVLSFQENYDTPTIDVPVWNMTIVHTREIEGVQNTDQKFNELPSKDFAGFVQYIERLENKVENVGIIHYTNLSPSNVYGEGFFYGIDVLDRLPRLTIPHVMWYNDTETTERLELKPDYVSLNNYPDINTPYFNLIDNGDDNGNGKLVVGKIFPELKIFLIEDQELLAALTYKSNRNWTLPQVSAGFNVTLERC